MFPSEWNLDLSKISVACAANTQSPCRQTRTKNMSVSFWAFSGMSSRSHLFSSDLDNIGLQKQPSGKNFKSLVFVRWNLEPPCRYVRRYVVWIFFSLYDDWRPADRPLHRKATAVKKKWILHTRCFACDPSKKHNSTGFYSETIWRLEVSPECTNLYTDHKRTRRGARHFCSCDSFRKKAFDSAFIGALVGFLLAKQIFHSMAPIPCHKAPQGDAMSMNSGNFTSFRKPVRPSRARCINCIVSSILAPRCRLSFDIVLGIVDLFWIFQNRGMNSVHEASRKSSFGRQTSSRNESTLLRSLRWVFRRYLSGNAKLINEKSEYWK